MESPLQTAMLLSLVGANCVVGNQWHTMVHTNLDRMTAMIQGMAVLTSQAWIPKQWTCTGLSLDPSNQWGPDYTWALGMWYCVFRPGKLDLLFRISTRDSFETYHLNCHYRLPMTHPLLMAITL